MDKKKDEHCPLGNGGNVIDQVVIKTTLVRQIFTFGYGQERAGGFTVIYAPSNGAARLGMFMKYDRHWAFQYDNELDAGVGHYNIHKVDEFTVNDKGVKISVDDKEE